MQRFGYARLKRAEKAVVLRFLERVSGYSRQQLTRLVKRGCERRPLIKRYRGSRTSFARIYTSADVLLLAHTDSLHSTLSGLATKKLMERAFIPAKTARAAVDVIQREAAKALKMPDVRDRILALGLEPVGSTPDEFDARVKADIAKFVRVVKEAHIPLQD